MTAAVESTRPYLEQFKTFVAADKSGSDWLPDLRQRAMAHFAQQGFPEARNENWKYTPTRSLEKRQFVPAMPEAAELPAHALDSVLLQDGSAYALIFTNGQLVQKSSDTVPTIVGLHITRLDTLLHQAPTPIRELLAAEPAWNGDSFCALNTAFLRDGIAIVLDDDVQLDAPIQLVFVSLPGTKPGVCHPRVLVQMGRNTVATLLQTWVGLPSAANFTNSYTQITLNEGARLEHIHLHREAEDEFHVNRVTVSQQAGSRYASHTFNLGGMWIRNDLHTRLEAQQAKTILNGLYRTDGRQHVDNHTRIDHLAPNTRSDELYRGIISGHAHAVFNGKVCVAKHAAGTDAAQANHNLLLSRQAEIDTKPELEIYADDVKCSHGATIGQLDEDALFYLRSRGLDELQARRLLVDAFALTVLDRVPSASLRTFLHRQLDDTLPRSTPQASA